MPIYEYLDSLTFIIIVKFEFSFKNSWLLWLRNLTPTGGCYVGIYR